MTLRNTLALSFAAALFSVTVAGAANAATTHRMMSHSHHMMHTRGHMAGSSKPMSADADHSADSLNAQSLTRTQTGQ